MPSDAISTAVAAKKVVRYDATRSSVIERWTMSDNSATSWMGCSGSTPRMACLAAGTSVAGGTLARITTFIVSTRVTALGR